MDLLARTTHVSHSNRPELTRSCITQGIKLLGDCEYVAIFDADFKPEPDFLLRTVPYLIGNSEIGYVQTRWTFTNPEESYLTKVRHAFKAFGE